MENQEKNQHKNLKRKKNRSANQVAKKFARRRNFEGTLDRETIQYMLRILDVIRNEFSTKSKEDIVIFVNNVYEQTVEKEIEFAKDQVGSRILDTLLKYADFKTVLRFAESFDSQLRPFCSDRFASHVLQKMIIICAHRGNLRDSDKEDATKIKDSEVEKYNEIALKLCKYVINNIEEFVWDTYANHILRTAIDCLGGIIDLDGNDTKKKIDPNIVRRKVIKEYTDYLISTCDRLIKLPQFQEFNHNNLTSGLVQTVLHSLHGVDQDLNSLVIKKIINECFKPSEENNLSDVFYNECSMRLLEVCLAVCNPKDFTSIYEKFFVNHLKELSLMKGANFCVQRLMENCHTKEEMEKIYDEIADHLGDVLKRNNTGIFASLAKALCRTSCRQGPFVNVMFKLLHCDKPEERQSQIVPLAATLKTFEDYHNLKSNEMTKNKIIINLHGSLSVQAMLNFNKPIKIVNSMLEMNSADLFELFTDPKGSRILDAFFDSKYVGEKSREKLAKNLRGFWAKLASSTHGSRCLDKVWDCAKDNQKNIIMEELAEVGELLRSTPTGKLISAKLNVPLFARSKKEWLEAGGRKEDKTKTLFADIIVDKKKKKKEK